MFSYLRSSCERERSLRARRPRPYHGAMATLSRSRTTLTLIFTISTAAAFARAQDPWKASIEREKPSLEKLYRELHQNPELSYHEEATAARIAQELTSAGFTVTTGFGKYTDVERPCHGVVGILKNGEGPAILVRTDLDSLPVVEKTGLEYASRVKVKNDAGVEVGAMHACGHDMHMTAFVGAARALAATRDQWSGTLIFVGQPAEEIAPGGAEAMLRAGLYTKFPKPDAAFALHCSPDLAAGKIGYVSGFALANADTVDITVRGAGGHGSAPQKCKDPVVLASEMVLAFQTIISREITPGEPAVITVGSIHGGTKHNIIPDEVKLQLTVRSYSDDTREKLLKGIERIALGLATAAGIPQELAPVVNLNNQLLVPATYNNPALAAASVAPLREAIGAENVLEMKPVLGAEDFGHFSLPDKSLPCVMFWLGSVAPVKLKESEINKKPLAGLHSSGYAPEIHPTIETGARALCAVVIAKLKKK